MTSADISVRPAPRVDVFSPLVNPWVWLLLAIVVLVSNAAWLSNWIVDDAGISLAYARNVAAGHGLVHQPGGTPVEGFSNPSWTLLLSALYRLGFPVLPWTIKTLALALNITTLWLLFRDLKTSVRGAWLAVPLVLVASASPFVIWTVSGLENALLATLVVLACTLTLRGLEASSILNDFAVGLVAGLLAITRPDAVLYAALHVPLTTAFTRRDAMAPRLFRSALVTGLGVALVAGTYFIFRWHYYHDWVPNTFHAKSHHSGGTFLDAEKHINLWRSVFGDAFVVAVPFLGLGLWAAFRGKRQLGRLVTIAAYLAVAVVSYVVLPYDWMGEFRFATAVFPLAFWLLAASAVVVVREWSSSRRILAVAGAVATAAALLVFMARTVLFARQPTFPLSQVQAYSAEGFNVVAEGMADASLLTPDLGGVLLESHLTVVDLAGLCDRTIAKSLGQDTAALHEYIFGERKPTFIRTHGPSLRITRLYDDPRFARDYVPLYEAFARDSQGWIRLWADAPAVPPWRGDYVRRDALRHVSLDTLKQRYVATGMDRWEPTAHRDVHLRRPLATVWAFGVIAGYTR